MDFCLLSLISLQEITKFYQMGEIQVTAIQDLNLEIEDFREKLEASLENSDYGFVKKQSIIRSKVQEFRMEKRKNLLSKEQEK